MLAIIRTIFPPNIVIIQYLKPNIHCCKYFMKNPDSLSWQGHKEVQIILVCTASQKVAHTIIRRNEMRKYYSSAWLSQNMTWLSGML